MLAQRYSKLWGLKQVMWYRSLIHISQRSASSVRYLSIEQDGRGLVVGEDGPEVM